MKVIVTGSYDESCAVVAEMIKDLVVSKPNAKLGLATGGTPVPIYKKLIAMNEAGEVDFSAVVNQIAAANPDAVYYGGNYPEGSLLLKQIRDKGITSIYVGSSGVDTSELVNIAGKENAAGAYYISSSPAFDSSAVLQEWVDRYQQTSGLAADGYAIYFYEAAAVALESLSNAIDAAGGKPTRAQVVEAMANVEITSITGTFQFDEKGDNINAKAYAYEIVDGYPGKLVGELTGA